MNDDKLLELLLEVDCDTYAVAEHLCDQEVAAGEYDGCSTDLELAFAEYQANAQRVLTAAGGAA